MKFLYDIGDIISFRKIDLTVVAAFESLDGNNYYMCAYKDKDGKVSHKLIRFDNEDPSIINQGKSMHFVTMKSMDEYKAAIRFHEATDILNIIPKVMTDEELSKLSLNIIKHAPEYNYRSKK